MRKIPGAKAGYASCGGVPVPAAEKEADYRAAYEKFFELDENCPLGSVSLYATVFFGRYPEEYYRRYQEIMPKIGERDMEIISSPVDFFAQNTYDGYYVGECGGKAKILPYAVGAPTTPMGWHIVPESLYYATKFLYERYKKPRLYLRKRDFFAGLYLRRRESARSDADGIYKEIYKAIRAFRRRGN